MNLSRRFGQASPATLSFVDQALVSGANFVGGILFARILGLGEFGRFTLAWLVVEFVATLQYAAILQPMLNIGPKQSPREKASYYSATLVLQIACGVVSAVGVWALLAASGPLWPSSGIAEAGAPIGVAIFATQAHNYLRRYCFAFQRQAAATAVDALRYGLQIAVTLLIAQTGVVHIDAFSGLWIIAATAAVGTLPGIVLMGAISINSGALRQALRRHWHFSKWLVPSAILRGVSGQLVMVMTGIALGTAAVGALGAVKTLLGVINVLLMGIENFAPVQSVRALGLAGLGAFYRYLGGLAVGAVALALGVALCLSIEPDRVMGAVYGNRFHDIGYLVRWLSVPYVLFALSTVLAIWAAAIESTKIIFHSSVASSLAAIIAFFPLAHYGGLTGVAVSFGIAELVRLLVLFWGLWTTKGLVARAYESANPRRRSVRDRPIGVPSKLNATVESGS